MKAGTVYTATEAASVADASGRAPAVASVQTFAPPVAPTVTAQAPAPGATGVPLNTTVTATFSKAMNAASITTSTFRLRAAGSTADVPATVTVNTARSVEHTTDIRPLTERVCHTVTEAEALT